MSKFNAAKPATNNNIPRVAEVWDAYRDSQPEDWDAMMSAEIGYAYNPKRKL